jgi:hypothetical protein
MEGDRDYRQQYYEAVGIAARYYPVELLTICTPIGGKVIILTSYLETHLKVQANEQHITIIWH